MYSFVPSLFDSELYLWNLSVLLYLVMLQNTHTLYHALYSLLFIDWGCFQYLSITNNTAMNKILHVLSGTCVYHSDGYIIPRNGTGGYSTYVMVNFIYYLDWPWAKHFCACWEGVDEISIWIRGLRKVDCAPQCEWDSSSSVNAWIE